MISYKVCMLGAFSVGKTSLVKRYVHSIFNEQYETTIGVKISKHSLNIDEQETQLLIWDIEGKDSFTQINARYLRGSSGVVLVADGTRPESINELFEIHALVREHTPHIPVVVMLNKKDLINQWHINEAQYELIKNMGWKIFESSAKTSENVEQAFFTLAKDMAASRSKT